jgi:hypothetical protein
MDYLAQAATRTSDVELEENQVEKYNLNTKF